MWVELKGVGASSVITRERMQAEEAAHAQRSTRSIKMHVIRSAALVGLCLFGISLNACVMEGESDPLPDDTGSIDEVTGTEQSELLELECSYVGGCTTWDAQNGCTELTCCTVCGSAYRCTTNATLGGEECIFYPSVN
jgi:hypothetical protein